MVAVPRRKGPPDADPRRATRTPRELQNANRQRPKRKAKGKARHINALEHALERRADEPEGSGRSRPRRDASSGRTIDFLDEFPAEVVDMWLGSS